MPRRSPDEAFVKTGKMDEMKRFSKIKLKQKDSSRELWVPVPAESIGGAVAPAGSLCFGAPIE